ncbi:MAG: tRNA (N(6)-L-threonylcarbamoyladenosine(37)-C(2))-methylthiotransferase [Candidatus Aenigmarchaeota archaeon]|nr:tRNA (N(6)-L-threonylcarbamoyladenosine(37)-C(2))-methylthiotransferase [Candidatus Aenigmarchaeota archaeon]
MALIYFETYGCSNNKAETQIMAGILHQNDHTIVDNVQEADLVIVNTCSVKSATEQKILYEIKTLQEQEKKIIIAGCMPDAEYDVVKKHAPDASLIGTHRILEIEQVIEAVLAGKHSEQVGKEKIEKIGVPRFSNEQTVHIIPIASGCISSCSFCSTKQAKGALFSYEPDHIVAEIKKHKDNGSTEFWLTSQDCGCYGFDKKTNLATLLEAITTHARGKYFIRVGMANPQHIKKILPELIVAYQNNHVFKFLHVPVQSGSDEMLRAMNRGHTVQDFIDVVNAFRTAIPEITIWTDMIVGFPGETEKDFHASMDLVTKIRPDYVNVSSYASRPNTAAARLHQVPTAVKKERTEQMSALVRTISLEKNVAWIGWNGSVIIDEYNTKKKSWIGRNPSYKPVVVSGDVHLGDVVTVDIVAAKRNHLVGIVQER